MTPEYIQQTARFFGAHACLIVPFLLILGLAGIFFQIAGIFTTISLLLSVTIIPGFVLVYHADRALIRKSPTVAIAAAILISITILILYVLICEILPVPMTVSSGMPAQPGVLFQAGILLYSGFALLVSAICSRLFPGSADAPSDPDINARSLEQIILVTILIAGIFWYGGGLLSSSNPDPATELFFADNPGVSENSSSILEQSTRIGIVNHEKRSVQYLLTILIPGRDLIRMPVNLTDGESWQTRIPLYNETTGLKNRPVQIRLYDDRNRERPYREIWRE
jgi:hypothetical protein